MTVNDQQNVLEYLLLIEVLEADLKLFIFGLHRFTQFLKDLGNNSTFQ